MKKKCACSRDSVTPRVQLNSLSRDNTMENQNVPSSPHHSPTSAVFETFFPLTHSHVDKSAAIKISISRHVFEK